MRTSNRVAGPTQNLKLLARFKLIEFNVSILAWRTIGGTRAQKKEKKPKATYIDWN